MTNSPAFSAVQWLLLLIALLTLLIAVEATLGHYRSGFPLRAQYTPLGSAGLLVIASVAAAVAPRAGWTRTMLTLSAIVAVASGLIGAGYHHWFGIVKKAGGYRWLL